MRCDTVVKEKRREEKRRALSEKMINDHKSVENKYCERKRKEISGWKTQLKISQNGTC